MYLLNFVLYSDSLSFAHTKICLSICVNKFVVHVYILNKINLSTREFVVHVQFQDHYFHPFDSIHYIYRAYIHSDNDNAIKRKM